MSVKPSPAIFAEDAWKPEQGKIWLQNALDKSQGRHNIEFIMKDISTVRYQPQRLWEWAAMTIELVE